MAERLVKSVRAAAPRTRDEAAAALVTAATSLMAKTPRELNLNGDPAVVLLYGVNGAGKTTTAGKLAHRL
ncbi:MAG TPA: signal recognition particle-docking protein FtsY, partial [Candidatus Limnocylindria bacterium]|nr:signal recognition particle-docking protein FtsY [Candidatus Limnocylindria bacterium]